MAKLICALALLASASAFAPATTASSKVALNVAVEEFEVRISRDPPPPGPPG